MPDTHDAIPGDGGSPAPAVPLPRLGPAQTFARLTALLEAISTDVSDTDFKHAIAVVHNETNGSGDGLQFAIRWSAKYCSDRTAAEVKALWNSFGTAKGNPHTIITLIEMASAHGHDGVEICNAFKPPIGQCDGKPLVPPQPAEPTHVTNITGASAETGADATAHSDLVEPPLGASETVIADASAQTAEDAKAASNPLDKYSLRDKLHTLMALAITAIAVLGQLVLMGQFTIFFAAANTGKTLLMFFFLIEAIQLGKVNPAKVFYFNMDDNAPGLIEKVRIAIELGFNIVADGYQDFSVKKFIVEITAMIESNQAHGVVIFLDTYKKFANVMDKSQASQFNRLLRRFVMKGGTVVALAHTNKKPGMDGRPVYGGTSDSVDDADCAYLMWSLPPQAGSSEKIIQFENIKRRGNVVQSAAYSYSSDPAISYSELLASVQIVDDAQLAPVIQAEKIRSDAGAIAAAEDCIREGINTKMLLADAVSKRASRSKRSAMQVVEKYTGSDPAIHRWTYSVHAHGAKVFELLPSAPPLPGTLATPPYTPTDDAL